MRFAFLILERIQNLLFMRSAKELRHIKAGVAQLAHQEKVEAKKLKGFRDFLPKQATLRKHITDRILANASMAGYQLIDTPALEYAETLLGSGGQETDKEVYRFEDHGQRAVALRFDLTVPFARYVAENYSDLIFPFKKVQIGMAWRGEKPQKGRYREFCQADLDIIGVDTPLADIEVLSSILSNLHDLVPGPFTMRVGHRLLLSELIKLNFPRLQIGEEVRGLIAIDKLAKIGKDAVIELMVKQLGVSSQEAATLLAQISTVNAAGDSDIEALREVFAAAPDALAELNRYEETIQIVRRLLPSSKARVLADLSIARGLGYYTGIVFETTIDGLDGFGSISSGGRYNGLVSRFSSMELPGVGGSIGVDRLLAALEQLDAESAGERKGIFVALAGSEARLYGFEILTTLRRQGLLADITLKEGKLGQQFKFADKRSYAWVITLGLEELQNQTLSLKHLQSGEEYKGVSLEKALEKMSGIVNPS